MRLQFENLNTNKIHDELIKSGIIPELVESLDNITWVTIADNHIEAVNAIVSIHDPTPLPKPKSELEIIKEALDDLILNGGL